MIRVSVEQGSPEWHAARLGIPTASRFGRILTPSGNASAQAESYLYELLAERLLGEPVDAASSDFMERGKALEDEAVAWYALQRDADPERVGFVLTDDRAAGCSPDRFVGEDGGLEIKCPSPGVHVGYLVGEGAESKYRPQVQGCLWITGRKWWDVLSYHPDLPPALVRVVRDEEYIEALLKAVSVFTQRLEQAERRLAERGVCAVNQHQHGGLDMPVISGHVARPKPPAASHHPEAT